MKLTIKKLKGELISMDVNDSDTIENIKLKIKENENIESENLNFVLNERYPTSDLTIVLDLTHYSIEELNAQINLLLNQTLLPKFIYGCFFGNIDNELLESYNIWNKRYPNIVYIKSNTKLCCLSRYYLSLNAPTKYIMILDNNRMPNKDFIKKNIEILKTQKCVIGQYGWILDSVKADYNGLFIHPNEDNLSFINKHFDLLTEELSDSILEKSEMDKYIKFSDNSNTLLNVDYLTGCLCFEKSLLYKLFDTEINIDIDIGEEILFCLKLKKKNIPIYCFTSYEDERLLLSNKDDIGTTSEIIMKRTKVIRDIL